MLKLFQSYLEVKARIRAVTKAGTKSRPPGLGKVTVLISDWSDSDSIPDASKMVVVTFPSALALDLVVHTDGPDLGFELSIYRAFA
jgi:hypothetical protein